MAEVTTEKRLVVSLMTEDADIHVDLSAYNVVITVYDEGETTDIIIDWGTAKEFFGKVAAEMI